MGIFRSEDMHFYTFTCFKDNAWRVLNELGKLSSCDFVDMNKGEQVFNLPYGHTLKRWEEMLRNLMILELECKNMGLHLKSPDNTEDYDASVVSIQESMQKTDSALFDEIEAKIKECTKFTTDIMQNYKTIKERFYQLLMHREVMKMTEAKKQDTREYEKGRAATAKPHDEEQKESLNEPLINQNVHDNFSNIQISTIAGVVDKIESEKLRRFIFRSTRGKAMFFTEDVSPELLKEEGIDKPKTMYIVMYERGETMDEKIKRICDSFMGDTYDLSTSEDYTHKIKEVSAQIYDSKDVMKNTKLEIKNYYISSNKLKGQSCDAYKVYEMYIRKQMLICETINRLYPENSLLHGFLWSDLTPQETSKIVEDLQSKHQFHGLQIHEFGKKTRLTPPTKIMTNEFLEPFQQIVNTYGVPSYKEVNPAVFTIITFPFLFGVMFGDLAHGFLLFLFSSYLCICKETIEKSESIFKSLLSARYLLLLMGFFATFSGLMYNDMMAIPLELFGSCYSDDKLRPESGWVYPIGVDPRWYRSASAITFVNSLKMKLSVIIAVSQMSLGVLMKAFNAIHFKSTVDFVFEFVPQITLLVGLFGYMDLMIIIKWLTDYTGKENEAPSIINTMINIPLKGAYIEGQPFISDMETNQNISLILLLIAVIWVPIMLIPKPVILISQLDHHDHDEHQHGEKVVEGDEDEKDNKHYQKLDDENAPKEENKEEHSAMETNKYQQKKEDLINPDGGEGHSGSEIFIHQLIETIEFVLGTISNTASYLRLWALSLAHSQLAEVFFELTLWSSVEAQSPVGIFIGFLVFGSATFAVLMWMDLMECFLHTLRLHWVEFQNKFYKGGGVLFSPLNFENLKRVEE